jgi:hypothetical protein
MRKRHLRISFRRALECGLGFRELAAIEQGDALVVERFRVAAARGIGRGRVFRCQRTLFGGQVELPLLVVDGGELRMRVGIVRFDLDRLLERCFRPR